MFLKGVLTFAGFQSYVSYKKHGTKTYYDSNLCYKSNVFAENEQ